MKKAWKRPELVVLVLRSDEERVLTACKDNDIHGGYQNTKNVRV
jgi:hypothetical protein